MRVSKVSWNERIRRGREGGRLKTFPTEEVSFKFLWNSSLLPGSQMSRGSGVCIGKSKGEKEGDGEVWDSFMSSWFADELSYLASLCLLLVPSSLWESSVRGSPQWSWGERDQEKQSEGMTWKVLERKVVNTEGQRGAGTLHFLCCQI